MPVMKPIKVAEKFSEDGNRRTEYYAVRYLDGWKIQKIITKRKEDVSYKSYEDAVDVIQAMGRNLTMFEFIGDFTNEYGRTVPIYATPLGDGMWGVEYGRAGTIERESVAFESLDAVREWAEWKYGKSNFRSYTP